MSLGRCTGSWVLPALGPVSRHRHREVRCHLVLRYEAHGPDGPIPVTMTLEPVDRFNQNVIIEAVDGQPAVKGKTMIDCHCASPVRGRG